MAGKRQKQTEIRFPRKRPKKVGWGGAREGAGRKRAPGRRRMPHRPREKLASRFPVHVTVRVVDAVARLRRRDVCATLKGAFQRCCEKVGFRICQFSVMGNHIHLLCEASDAVALARGIQGWKVAAARRLNKLLRRSGTVFEDRYHVEILRTPSQVRNAVCYVMQNARRHGLAPAGFDKWVDPFSSARYFDGWSAPHGLDPPDPDEAPPVAAARTWLLATGWRMRGLIGLDEVPRARAAN